MEKETRCPTPGKSPGFYGEHLEHTQKISNSNGLAGLSSVFLGALEEKAGRAVPMPKASDQ